jgi:hypothetical protein
VHGEWDTLLCAQRLDWIDARRSPRRNQACRDCDDEQDDRRDREGRLVNERFGRTYLDDGRSIVGRRVVGMFPRMLGRTEVVREHMPEVHRQFTGADTATSRWGLATRAPVQWFAMVTRGIREFMGRAWDDARRAKDAYWGERIARLGPLEGLRIADELRQQMLRQDSGWPGAEGREADLAAHARLAELFRRAHAARRT